MQFLVNIEEIREKGLDYQRDLPEEFVEAALGGRGSADFHAAGASRFQGRFEQSPGRVLLNGHIDLEVKAPCKRCLTEVKTRLPLDFHLSFVKQAAAGESFDDEDEDDEGNRDEEGQNASFDKDDVDTEPFDGHKILLDGVLREQMLLGLPMDVLCKPDCKGLCVVCGQDRNQVDCGHEQKVPDPRWSALKNLKLPN
jgi:uncharacterized protein